MSINRMDKEGCGIYIMEYYSFIKKTDKKTKKKILYK